MEPLLVTAAIIRKNDKVLITQRLSDAANEPNKWEFPGGKKEAHETLEESLIREVKEELGIDILLGHMYATTQHQYKNGIHVVLVFYLAEMFSGEIQLLGCQDAKWVGYDELKQFEFAEADVPIVKELMHSRP